ncbi:1-deoxy-D-xylulose-5-phosphate synthase, partial [candidate division WOR-3 bacterium]|nr:1-deoxy-D-xylulose-5-phosphate synthase [candidate division WOR-3 bacterium]
MKKILDSVNMPQDIKDLKIVDLKQLAQEIRDYIVDVTSRTGGHVAPSLGAVEIMIALHYVFDTPRDKFVIDVGHQAYTHKILTGRKDAFKKIR